MAGKFLEKLAEAEIVTVKGTHQFPDPVRTRFEILDPASQLSGREIIPRQSLDDRVRRQFPGLEGKVDAATVDRVNKSKGIPDQHPAVSGLLAGAVREFLGNAVAVGRLGR